jgi:hypothetical protein
MRILFHQFVIGQKILCLTVKPEMRLDPIFPAFFLEIFIVEVKRDIYPPCADNTLWISISVEFDTFPEIRAPVCKQRSYPYFIWNETRSAVAYY